MLLSLLAASNALAHSSFMSFYKITQKPEDWALTVVLARGGVDKTMSKIHTASTYQQADEATQKKWLVDYLLKSTQINISDKVISLEPQKVVLNGHEARIRFTLIEAPKKVNSIAFHIWGFASSKNHHNIVLLDAPGFPEKIVLSKQNEFKQTIIKSAR